MQHERGTHFEFRFCGPESTLAAASRALGDCSGLGIRHRLGDRLGGLADAGGFRGFLVVFFAAFFAMVFLPTYV